VLGEGWWTDPARGLAELRPSVVEAGTNLCKRVSPMSWTRAAMSTVLLERCHGSLRTRGRELERAASLGLGHAADRRDESRLGPGRDR
jgi:hypothetical protein